MKAFLFICSVMMSYVFCILGMPHACYGAEDNIPLMPQKRVGSLLQENPLKKKRNLLDLFNGDENKDPLNQQVMTKSPRFNPTFTIKNYNYTSFEDVKFIPYLPEATAFIVDFDGTFARRIFKVINDEGVEEFTIRYASSAEWNSAMYEPFFKKALNEIGKTTSDFDQLFAHFKEYVSYEVLDESLLPEDLVNIHKKVILSGKKDTDKKKSLYEPYGFSYASSRNKSGKISNLLGDDYTIRDMIFIDNDPKNTKDVSKNLSRKWALTYDVPVSINLHVIQFDCFTTLLELHHETLKKELIQMFAFAEKRMGAPIQRPVVLVDILQDSQCAENLQSCDEKAQEPNA